MDGELQLLPSVDISVAVVTESGLITPIVKNANRSSVETISATVKVRTCMTIECVSLRLETL